MDQAPPAPSVAFTGTLTRAEFDRVQLHLLPPWARWYVCYPMFAVVVFFVSPTRDLPIDPWLKVLFAAIPVIGLDWLMRKSRTKAWNQLMQLGGRVSGSISAEGIEWRTAMLTTRFDWSKVVRVAHADGLTLAFYTPRCAFYFPRSFFESDQVWAAFNAEIDAHTGN